jgi:hypothetical protein
MWCWRKAAKALVLKVQQWFVKIVSEQQLCFRRHWLFLLFWPYMATSAKALRTRILPEIYSDFRLMREPGGNTSRLRRSICAKPSSNP